MQTGELSHQCYQKKIGEIYTNENIIHRWHISTCDDDDTGKDSE